jgi:hypothetical protein
MPNLAILGLFGAFVSKGPFFWDSFVRYCSNKHRLKIFKEQGVHSHFSSVVLFYSVRSLSYADDERIRGACGWHRAGIAPRPETSMILPALRWATLSGACTVFQSRLVLPDRVQCSWSGPGGVSHATLSLTRLPPLPGRLQQT